MNKIKSTITVLIFIMIAPMAQGMHPVVPSEIPAGREVTLTGENVQQPVMLAENEENTDKDKARTATGSQERVTEPGAGPEIDRKGPSTDSKTAPLKPFKPSEEIAAEQAVDFPVDI